MLLKTLVSLHTTYLTLADTGLKQVDGFENDYQNTQNMNVNLILNLQIY